jgi:pimeloyl-ACP methyl ester carboxylesterase
MTQRPEPTIYQPRRAPLHEERAVRGIDHHLTRWPGSDPEPWLLLHGWMDAGGTFQFVADSLPATRSLVALDWRGFGESAWPDDGYWFPDYYADLDALLEQLSPDAPAALIGHSMGGNIAMMYAGIRPERVRAVVCIDAFGLPRTRPEQAPERYRTWLMQLREAQNFARFASHEAFAQFLSKRNRRLRPDRAAFIARAWSRSAPDGGVVMRADPRHKRVNPVLYRREEAEACWRAIRAPLLFIVAADAESAVRFGEDAAIERMRGFVPQLVAVTVDDSGHMVHHEQPEALAAAIEQFMVSLDDTAPEPR